MDYLEAGEPVVLYEMLKEKKIAKISLNRKKTFNAAFDPMYLAAIEAFTKAELDEDVALVVLTGTGDFFCSGADLKVGIVCVFAVNMH
jgi:enoyl-CoA hydratase/carnithine racemase